MKIGDKVKTTTWTGNSNCTNGDIVWIDKGQEVEVLSVGLTDDIIFVMVELKDVVTEVMGIKFFDVTFLLADEVEVIEGK